MKFLSIALMATLAALANAAVLDHPLEKRCVQDYGECSTADDCCTSGAQCVRFETEFRYCEPTS
ncbi:uncharacterized protein N7459_000579 [Penicillium hispanicum]|uniref:uncharacterized protein n=1 Tax=Penicillium hispanicum TaxID=1080232 RepID=UPI002541D760|nr:uncharacterized protein N7459_000579 [Penicillium hispanicum]KAJ5594371.1 hypothetical protein N7459_000579 [Penicillium hispanicum]